MANALVLGANGFIGSHLVEALVAAGHRVTAFGRFDAPVAFDALDVRILRGEFLNRADVEAAVEGQQVVFHLVSTTTPATAESDPSFDVRTNVLQTIALLEACVTARVEHVYFASTGGAIYGTQRHGSFNEDSLTSPVSPYAIGKLTIENYLRYFGRVHGLGSTTFRISNPYGPRQDGHGRQGLIGVVLQRIRDQKPVVRLGDGSMVRDYLYVSDLVEMIVDVVARPNHRHDLYNLASGVGHTVNEVLDSVRRVTREDFLITTAPAPPTFISRVVLDTSRFDEEFGTRTLTDLDAGIAAAWKAILAG